MLRKLPLYPFERVAAGAVILTTATLLVLQLPTSTASVLQTINALAQLPIPLVLGAILFGYYHYAAGGMLSSYLRDFVKPVSLLLWLRLWLACCVVSFCYFWIKVYVPLINTETWDQTVAEIDRWTHLGFSPSAVSVKLLAATPLLGWLDWWYALWLATVIWFLAFFTASPDRLLRRRVVLSCLLLWISGAALYALVPVRGPIFEVGHVWSNMDGAMPRAEQMQQLLGDNYQAVLAYGRNETVAFDHRLGVAALPSLHVGFHFLFVLWAWHDFRVLTIPFVILMLLTMLGSVTTGWHYAVDGYAGMVLAYGTYRLALRWEQEDSVA